MASDGALQSATFQFLRDLAANNNREWFEENRSRYEEEWKEPAQRFVTDFTPHLKGISTHFRADPGLVGGSIFRIYRDVRFSKDKSPYKTHLGIQFRHERGKDVHAPGFYLHLEPDNVFAGVGLWHPDSPTLRTIRDALVEDPDAWTEAVGDGDFRNRFELAGDSLVRAPRGYDPEHPLIGDLKRKDFIAVCHLSEAEATEPSFVGSFAEVCRAGSPLVRYLCGALDLPF